MGLQLIAGLLFLSYSINEIYLERLVKIEMFSPSIQKLIEQKSGSFMIPASKIAFVQEDNPLYHAFMILTKVKYSKIPVLDDKQRIVGLISLAMITDTMLKNDGISTESLNDLTVKDVMQTDFQKLNFSSAILEDQLHLLVDNNFIPIVNDDGVFCGMVTRREWLKAFNYVVHNFEDHYIVTDKQKLIENHERLLITHMDS